MIVECIRGNEHQWAPWREAYLDGGGWHRYCYLCGVGQDRAPS